MIGSHLRFVLLAALVSPALALGCVSTTLNLAPTHPARPGVSAGVAPDPAAILRGEPPAAQGVATPRGASTGQVPPDGSRQNPYVGRGVVRDLRPGALVVAHEAIPGLMGAMTMAYPVSAEVDLAGLSPGDAIGFQVEVPSPGAYRIFAVTPMPGMESSDSGHDHTGTHDGLPSNP